MEHEEIVGRYLCGPGVEIGAFRTPIPGITPIYVDRFKEYAGHRTLADYYGDACELPFMNSSLQYVASSHVIEHVANPLQAIKEWYRVLEHRGMVYALVPDRRKIFDRPRALTDPTHILSDYLRGTTQSDATHIDEFCFGVDWPLYRPEGKPDNEAQERQELARSYRDAVASGGEINIHFHTFQPESFLKMIELGNSHHVWRGAIRIVEVLEEFPTHHQIGFLVIARIFKTPFERASAVFSRRGVKADARKF